MRVFISADMEGISGIATAPMTDPSDKDYGRARELMTADVAAAVDGAVAGGASEIVVRDAHGPATNILPERLAGPARLLQGWNGQARMVEGIREGFDALLLVGYHARAMTAAGTISHTMSGQVRGLWLNGVEVGEIGISAAHAGKYGVPLAFISGDEAACGEARALVGEGLATAVVKRALSRESVSLLPIDEAHQHIRDAVEEALSGTNRPAPFVPQPPIEMKLQFQTAIQAYSASLVPTVRRVDDTTVAAEVADGELAANLLSVLLRAAR